ncbi:MAG: hypothetical protein K2X09_06500 [Rickettsiales bacterium]|nr:hypothetical protein [Rickettsiales bacterium]
MLELQFSSGELRGNIRPDGNQWVFYFHGTRPALEALANQCQWKTHYGDVSMDIPDGKQTSDFYIDDTNVKGMFQARHRGRIATTDGQAMIVSLMNSGYIRPKIGAQLIDDMAPPETRKPPPSRSAKTEVDLPESDAAPSIKPLTLADASRRIGCKPDQLPELLAEAAEMSLDFPQFGADGTIGLRHSDVVFLQKTVAPLAGIKITKPGSRVKK